MPRRAREKRGRAAMATRDAQTNAAAATATTPPPLPPPLVPCHPPCPRPSVADVGAAVGAAAAAPLPPNSFHREGGLVAATSAARPATTLRQCRLRRPRRPRRRRCERLRHTLPQRATVKLAPTVAAPPHRERSRDVAAAAATAVPTPARLLGGRTLRRGRPAQARVRTGGPAVPRESGPRRASTRLVPPSPPWRAQLVLQPPLSSRTRPAARQACRAPQPSPTTATTLQLVPRATTMLLTATTQAHARTARQRLPRRRPCTTATLMAPTRRLHREADSSDRCRRCQVRQWSPVATAPQTSPRAGAARLALPVGDVVHAEMLPPEQGPPRASSPLFLGVP